MMSPDEEYSQPGDSSIDNGRLFLDTFDLKHQVMESEKNESVDAMLANELNKLSFQERESINDEIHGIDIDRKYIEESGAVEETPEILSKSLTDMQSELDSICSIEGRADGYASAFRRSQQVYGSNPEDTYLNTAEFRLMFLRCERFDCKKAAERLCRYAALMKDIYGDFALQRLPCLSDLDDDDLDFINYCQFFPDRDRAGRRIYLCFIERQYNDRTRLRVPMYCFMSLVSNDVESQRKGVVAVMWMHNIKNMDITDFSSRGKCQNRCLESFPVRVGAGHFCFPTIQSAKDAAFCQIVKGLAGRLRPHIRIHTGSPMECIYALSSFGISAKHNPIDITTGELDLSNQMRWLKLCKAREENSVNLKHVIECPKHTDILFGRGQIAMRHPGNIMFRNFISSNLEVYSNIQSKKESTSWTWGVVRTLKTEHGARFLKEEQISNDILAWTEVSNETARSKVRIAFRDARTRFRSMGKDGKTVENKPTKTKRSGIKGNKLISPIPMSPMSSSLTFLSKRKSQEQFGAMPGVTFNSSIDTLNDNLNQLNSNLNALMQNSNSSTLNFLGFDGSNNSKRQRLESQKKCFDFG